MEQVTNPMGEVVDKRPIEFEKRRWDRGIKLGAEKRKRDRIPPLPKGQFQTPWSTAIYEMPPEPEPPKPKAAKPKARKPKVKYETKNVTVI